EWRNHLLSAARVSARPATNTALPAELPSPQLAVVAPGSAVAGSESRRAQGVQRCPEGPVRLVMAMTGRSRPAGAVRSCNRRAGNYSVRTIVYLRDLRYLDQLAELRRRIYSRKRFAVRHRTAIGVVVGGAVLAYLIILNAAHRTPLLAIMLIVLVGVLCISVGIWVTNRLFPPSD